MLVKLTSSDTMVEQEPPKVILELPRLRPFDISILFDHVLDKDVWRSDLKMLGIDIAIAPLLMRSLLLLPAPRLLAPKNYFCV